MTSIVVTTYALVVGFDGSKHIIRRGMTTLISYLHAIWIAFPHPHQVFHNTQRFEV
jgi:hypothetical protein